MALADLPVVSTLRGQCPSSHASEACCSTRVLAWGLDALTTFGGNYSWELNHDNPRTRASTRWGLRWALWGSTARRKEPCVRAGQGIVRATPSYDDRFQRDVYLMDMQTRAVDEDPSAEVPPNPLGLASVVAAAANAHAALAAGYVSMDEKVRLMCCQLHLCTYPVVTAD